MSSEVEEKRQLIKLVLSNLRLEGENIVYDAQKPFDLILNCSDGQEWCAQYIFRIKIEAKSFIPKRSKSPN